MMGRKAPERDNLEERIPLSVLMTLGENLATLRSPLLILGYYHSQTLHPICRILGCVRPLFDLIV